MYRAFTLIELVITLAVITLTYYFITPILFRLQDHIIINTEADNIRAFIYQIQSKARYQKKHYSLTISRNNHRWCMIAVAKNGPKETACDCLNIKSCQVQDGFYLYQSNQNITLKSNSLYPKVFSNIDGIAARLSSKCLGLQLNQVNEVLQFNQNGVINVIQKNKRSQCH